MQLRFTGHDTDPETADSIARLILRIPDERLDKEWKRVEAVIHPPAETDTALEQMHKVWNSDHVAAVKSPEGSPRLPRGAQCPAGSLLVEVSYISRPSGGMGSYHQFDGYFVSLVLAPKATAILDARIEKAY